MSRFSRVIVESFHGFDGKEMNLGNKVGSITEYDQESAICALIEKNMRDERKRIEYNPKTKRQFESIMPWRDDLKLIIRCNFLTKDCHFYGTYNNEIAERFPRMNWKGSGPITLVLNKITSLQNANITAKDIVRSLVFLV